MIKHKSVNYIHFTSIPSTSSWAKENSSLFDSNKLTCITAEEQTQGRGTFSKKWISPKGVNIYGTFYFTLPKFYPFLQNIGQLLSISCCKALEPLHFNPQIKWPNDLLIENKKFAGILCEATSSGEKIGIALGLGLNVNMNTELLKNINQPATSLMEISDKTWNLEEILSKILQFFLEDLDTLSSKGFAFFASFYNDRLAFKEQLIQVKDGAITRKGICKGVSPEGSLLLELSSGELIKISSGKIET
ncbi:MAG: biotin--[acetyl-CoA-carboxylase] ligase [Verrucomicrobia bacterium]|nr:biotin--[acetyl-CoA-carboxylase] ligase [Verrucomicrobiota bacterium]